jgi:hypothetical protein
MIPKYVKEVLIKQGLMNKEVVKKALSIDASLRKARKKKLSELWSSDLVGKAATKTAKKKASRSTRLSEPSLARENMCAARGEEVSLDRMRIWL